MHSQGKNMHAKIVVQDTFLNAYRLHLRHEPPVHPSLKPEKLLDKTFTHSFVWRLQVENEQWLSILYRVGYLPTRTHDGIDIRNGVIKAFVEGIIKAYPLSHLKLHQKGNRYPRIKTEKNKTIHFIPASMLLLNTPEKMKTFNNPKSASNYIEQLALSDEQLHSILKPLGSSVQSTNRREDLSARLIKELSHGQVVVVEKQNHNAPPKKAKEEQSLPAIGAGNKPATLGPHDGLHNEEWEKVEVKDDSFTTTKQVDMDDLAEDEELAKEELLDQGRTEEDIEQVIGSGNSFEIKNLQKGDKLYGFDTSTNKYGAKKQDSMYWLDEAGYNNVKKEYYNNGQWNKEGVKNFLALPCMNRADVIDVATVTEDQQAIESTVGIAREQIAYTRTDYSTGMLGKIMPGKGIQITPDPSKTSAVTRLTGTP